MKIEQTGEYQTQDDDRAVVAAIKGKFALGWVEKGETCHPTSWVVDTGKVWTGHCGHDLVAPWAEPQPTQPALQIATPGLYRDESDRKIEVLAIRDGFAIGYLPYTCPPAHGCWDAATGRDTDNPGRGSNLVAEWREPRSQTVTFAMIERRGEIEVVWARNVGIANVLARRTVTITEGEGIG